MKKYLIVSPFDSGMNGVNSYIQNAKPLYPEWLNLELLFNNKNETIESFRDTVAEFVIERYGQDEILIEVPDTKSAGLLIDKGYRVHTRMHTPLGICSMAEGSQVHQGRFSDEIRAIKQATIASSPSYGLLKVMAPYISTGDIAVFKNGITKDIKSILPECKTIDVLFMGRFQRLKGSQYLNAFLYHLPSNFRVVFIGKGASKFKVSPLVKASVETYEHINGDQRFDYLANSRVAIVPSLFENCSMMILEAIKAHVPVVAWAVGGNQEFDSNLVKTVLLDDVSTFARKIINTIEQHPSAASFEVEVNRINNDFKCGIEKTIDFLEGRTSKNYRSGIRHESSAGYLQPLPCRNAEEIFGGKRILGFTISNEHIEEMWMPVVNFLGMDYRFVCKRPLGFHSKFENKYPVDLNKFTQFDWIDNPERLFKNIETFKPHILLLHNGAHPVYQSVIKELKLRFDIPILYSELGWFPQNDHIYFDRRGTNGASSLAKMGPVSSFVADDENHEEDLKMVVFVPLQLDNDTNLKIFSPRFRTGRSFLSYVIEQLPEECLIHIKPHPLDRNYHQYKDFSSDRVFVHEIETEVKEILPMVGHVIGINTTVLVEALDYPVNIYHCGEAIIAGKDVAISFVNSELKSVFKTKLFGSVSARNSLKLFLQERQVKISELATKNLSDCVELPISLLPFVEAVLISASQYGVSPVAKVVPKIVTKLTVMKVTDDKPNKKTFAADLKIKKLLRFKVFFALYSRFLSEQQRKKLYETPSEFFISAKHPVSKFGATIMRGYF
jgi:hypothetical protein